MTTTPAAPLPLLVLGRGRDLHSERGVECPGDLPAPSDPGLVERARAAKAALGDKVFVLGHHHQRDEVIEFADVTVEDCDGLPSDVETAVVTGDRYCPWAATVVGIDPAH